MEETILVEITMEGKKYAITISPTGCELDKDVEPRKVGLIASILGNKISDMAIQKMHYQSLFGSAENGWVR